MSKIRKIIDRHRVALLFVILMVTWIVLLLPSALLNQWFTLDLGTVFTAALDYPHNLMRVLSPYGNGGRDVPFYWIYNFVVFRLFPANIAANYLVQVLLFIISLGLTSFLFYKITDNAKATLIFGVAACLGGAVTENLYTLGKAEPLAYLFVIAIFFIFFTMNPRRRTRSAVQFFSIGVLSALAMWSKETSLVLLVFCPVAIVATMAVNREWIGSLGKSGRLLSYPILFMSILGGYLISKVPYFIFSNNGNSTNYIDYKINLELVAGNLKYYVTQEPDVLLFGVVALVLCGMAMLRLRVGEYESLSKLRSNMIFVIGLLLMAWSYYLGLLIWRWPMGYYMLLPSIIFKFAAFYGLVFFYENKMFSTGAFRSLCFGVFICISYAFIQSFYVASSQISYSRMYTEAVSKYLAVSKPKNRLVIESFPFYAEQVINTAQLISVMSGENRVVGGIADLLNPSVATPDMLKLLGISQKALDENEKQLPVKDDYLLVMTGDKLGTWSVRGVTPYFSKESILKGYGAYDMKLIAEDKQFSPSAYLNIWTNKLDFGSTFFGYKLYKVTDNRPKIFWKGRYPDGWIGKTASIRLFPEFGKHVLITVSTPNFNSPNKLTVTQDGVPIRSVTLVEGKELSFEICNCGEKVPTIIKFFVEKTSVPRKLKVNKDERELGILIRAEARP